MGHTIDMQREHLITLADAAKSLPGRVHVSTIHRWRLRGCRGIRLDTLLVGGIRYTSTEALQRFAERLTAAASGEVPPNQTARQRRVAEAEADRILDGAGV